VRPDYPRYRIEPGEGFRMRDYDPDASEDYRKKKDVVDELAVQRERISSLQERLYAEHKRSLLVVLQAMDTGGKDGTIRSVFEGVNPQGCQVWSFKRPEPGGARSRLSLALPRQGPVAGPHHDLQPLALRGRADRAGEEHRAGGGLAPPLRHDLTTSRSSSRWTARWS
jgi:hypothetical protein